MNYIKDYFKDAKKGDEVIDITNGKIGTIFSTDYSKQYPIFVIYGNSYMTYTLDGKAQKTQQFQQLFYYGYEPKIKIPKPPKKREFEFEYEEHHYEIGVASFVAKEKVCNKYYRNMCKYGRLRQTKEAAYQALKLQTRVMRLHTLAEQLGELKEFERGEENFAIHCENGYWLTVYEDEIYEPEKVYMTKECAEKICEMLNNGEFNLEVENERD